MSRGGLVASNEMAARPRILCVMQLPPPLHGVTAINAQIAASPVIAEQFELEVLPLQFSKTIAELGRISLGKLLRAGGVLAKLAWVLARRRPAAVYLTIAPQLPALYRDVALLALVRVAGVPRIVHFQARPTPEVLPLLRHALRGATVILLSPVLRSDLGDAIEDARVTYVANGIADLACIERSPHPVPRVLFVSNLLVEKGPLVLVEALSLLEARGIAFEVTFAGAPSRAITETVMRQALAPFGPRARYLGRVVPEEVPALYRDHDVFVYPTTSDAMPLTILEAMRAGLPIVASDVGTIGELLADTGVVVEPNQPLQLAMAIARLLAEPGSRAELGRSARARFVANYTQTRFDTALADAFMRGIAGCR
ncbi:hypothetical protein BH11MYX1_BH11MYX1_35100 [soil metagenome]